MVDRCLLPFVVDPFRFSALHVVVLLVGMVVGVVVGCCCLVVVVVGCY